MRLREHKHIQNGATYVIVFTLTTLLVGCHIQNIRQPRFAHPNETILVELHTESSPNSEPTDAQPILGVKLPIGWDVLDNPVYWATGNNSGTLTYSTTLASELNATYGGTWWAGEGPLTTWPVGTITATGIITLEAAPAIGDYMLEYIAGFNDAWGVNNWGDKEQAPVTLTYQHPVHSAAVASVRDYPSLGTGPSMALQEVQERDMEVVYHCLGWDTIEHKPGHYDWDILEDILAQVEAYNLKVVLRVYNPPPWRTPDGAPPGAPPASNDDFRDFMQRLTARVRYGDEDFYARPERVAGYVIWNEPNIMKQWGGQAPDPAAYMAMLRAAYVGAKEGDPATVIISAPLAPTADNPGEAINDLIFLSQLYDNGLADYTDYVGMNGLGFQHNPDHDTGVADYNLMRLTYLRDVMVAKGDTTHKVWALEVGWLRDSDYDMGTFEPFKVSAAEQTQYLTRAFEKAQAEWPWMELMAVWNIDFNRYYPPTSNFHWYSIVHSWNDTSTYLPIILRDSR